MKSYIIAYRTSNKLLKPMVERKIKSFSKWALIVGDYWFVKTTYSAKEIFNMIDPLVGLSGRVVVLGVKRNGAWDKIGTSDFLYENL